MQVAPVKAAEEGKPSVSGIYRNKAAVEALPETYNGCGTLYELFNKTVEICGSNRRVREVLGEVGGWRGGADRRLLQRSDPRDSAPPGPLPQMFGIAVHWRGWLRGALPVLHLQGDAGCAGCLAQLLRCFWAEPRLLPNRARRSLAAADMARQLAAALTKAGFKPKDKLGIYSGAACLRGCCSTQAAVQAAETSPTLHAHGQAHSRREGLRYMDALARASAS